MFRYNADRLLVWSLRACAVVAAAILLLIVAFLVAESVPALRHIGLYAYHAGFLRRFSALPASPPWGCRRRSMVA